MSVSQVTLGAAALKSRLTRSSCTGGPGVFELRRPFLVVVDQIRCSRAQPLDTSLTHRVTGPLELVGDEAIAELRVVSMDVDDLIGQVGGVSVPVADGIGLPLVGGLGAEAEHPAGRRDVDAVSGQLLDQRVDHFGRASLAK
jgi:hypothetical protein